MTRSDEMWDAASAASGADAGVVTAATIGSCTGGHRAQDACLPARHSGASTDQISSSCLSPRYR